MLDLKSLFVTPDEYLHSFEGDSALFVPMDRASYRRSIFLDHRIDTAAERSHRVPVEALTEPSSGVHSLNWIFHMAHGGSTLLARALDRIDANLVLREPVALRQLALSGNVELLPLALSLLGRRYRPDLPTIIKANVPVNFLLRHLGGTDNPGRAILLHSTLADYLLAILRSPDHRRWVRGIAGLLAVQVGDTSSLSDAECAAALWLAQMREFAAATARSTAAKTLDSEVLFANSRSALQLAAEHLEVPMTDKEIDAVVDGPLFATYSKNPAMPFDNASRLARRAGLEQSLAADLAQAAAWIDRRRDEADRAMAAVAAADLLRQNQFAGSIKAP